MKKNDYMSNLFSYEKPNETKQEKSEPATRESESKPEPVYGCMGSIANAKLVNLRSSPEIGENNVILQLQEGYRVKILSKEGEFFKVEYKYQEYAINEGRIFKRSIIGYILSKYVSILDEKKEGN